MIRRSGCLFVLLLLGLAGVYGARWRRTLPVSHGGARTDAAVRLEPDKQVAVPDQKAPSQTSTAASAPEPSDPADPDDAMDRYALATPAEAEGSVASLAAYLIRPAKNDREKARALFRWIADRISYDVPAYKSGDYSHLDLSAAGALQSRCTICSGYSALFAGLAQAAGLQVAIVDGDARCSLPSLHPRADDDSNHAWNAVKINGQWQLLDCTWGAGDVDLEKGTYTKRFKPFFFCTPPDQFIYSHLPRDPKWQLRASPMSRSDQEQLPLVESAFFAYHIRPDSHPRPHTVTDTRLQMTFACPEDVLLTAQLFQEKRGLEPRLTFTQREDGLDHVYAVFPDAGEYTLRIYAKRRQDTGNYEGVMEYRVRTSEGLGENAGFPEAYRSFLEGTARLYGPFYGSLNAGKQTFKLSVPGVSEVFVESGGQRYPLQRDGPMFSGEAALSPGDAIVYARPNRQQRYEGYLKYTVR